MAIKTTSSKASSDEAMESSDVATDEGKAENTSNKQVAIRTRLTRERLQRMMAAAEGKEDEGGSGEAKQGKKRKRESGVRIWEMIVEIAQEDMKRLEDRFLGTESSKDDRGQ